MVKYKSPHIPMHDVARVYDALEIGLIITTSDGTIIWEINITVIWLNLISDATLDITSAKFF